jgi:hypothetical protein
MDMKNRAGQPSWLNRFRHAPGWHRQNRFQCRRLLPHSQHQYNSARRTGILRGGGCERKTMGVPHGEGWWGEQPWDMYTPLSP